MANIFRTIANLVTAFAQDVNQFVQGFNGTSDIGDITAFSQITTLPTALMSTATGTGSLSGAYSYVVTYVTGLLDGTGQLHVKGETTPGTASVVVNPSSQNLALSNIPIGPTGVIARNIYRTKAGGNTYYFAFQIADNTTTSWTDTTADTALGTQASSTNTTGSRFVGNGSGLTNLTASQVGAIPTSAEGVASGVATLDTSGNVPLSQLGNIPTATTTTKGLVKASPSISVASDGTMSATAASVGADAAGAAASALSTSESYTNTKVAAITPASIGAQPALGYTPVNKAGDTMTGTLTVPQIVVSGNVSLDNALLRVSSGQLQISSDGGSTWSNVGGVKSVQRGYATVSYSSGTSSSNLPVNVAISPVSSVNKAVVRILSRDLVVAAGASLFENYSLTVDLTSVSNLQIGGSIYFGETGTWSVTVEWECVEYY